MPTAVNSKFTFPTIYADPYKFIKENALEKLDVSLSSLKLIKTV